MWLTQACYSSTREAKARTSELRASMGMWQAYPKRLLFFEGGYNIKIDLIKLIKIIWELDNYNPIIPGLRRLRQKDYKPQVSLSYIVKPCLKVKNYHNSLFSDSN